MWTDGELGISVPPSGSILRISMIESQAAVGGSENQGTVRMRIYHDWDCQWPFTSHQGTWSGAPLMLSMAVSANVSVAVAPERSRSHSDENEE